MKLAGAVFVACLAVGPLSAQHVFGGFGSVAFPAGRASTFNPWGNVVTPARPQGPFVNNHFGNGHGFRGNRASGVYAFPAFIGSGYGCPYGYGPDQSAAPAQDNGGASPAPAPPVVINQYFGTPPPDREGAPAAADSNFHYYQSPTDAGAPPADATYYLIAFKDHTIYSAVAYYTEGDTLHYFTAGNVHNQVSLSLVDRQLTEQLNRQHNVELRLPQ
jgi:hypothetical protein